MTVFYEWDVEEVAGENLTDGGQDYEAGDVMEHYFQLSYKGALGFMERCKPVPLARYEAVLVRDDDKGRSWAYLIDNKRLPEYFTDAYGNETTKVPKRFHAEVKRNSK